MPLAFWPSCARAFARPVSESALWGSAGACSRMPCREDLELKVCDSVFRAGVCVPVYAWQQASLGARFWHDHRYLCSQAGITWLYQFAKQQNARGILQRVRADNDLQHFDLMKNESVGRHLPLLLSTNLVVGWLAERFVMGVHAANRADPASIAGWHNMLLGVQSAIGQTLQAGVLQGVPQIHAMDLTLDIGPHATINLSPLVALLPTLPREWEALAARDLHHLPRYSDTVAAMDLFRFLMLRHKFSAIPPEHPFTLLRTALVHVVGFLLEAAIEISIADTRDRFAGRPPPLLALFGPSQRTKAHHIPAAKVVAMASLDKCHGSAQTIMSAQGLFKGSSSQLRNAKLTLYKADSVSEFKGTNVVWLSHDGSCHGGTSMAVAAAVDPIRGKGCYIKPEACSNYRVGV